MRMLGQTKVDHLVYRGTWAEAHPKQSGIRKQAGGWVGWDPLGWCQSREKRAPGWLFDMDVSKNGGTQQPWVFLLKMIILGCFGGIPIFGNTHIGDYTTQLWGDFDFIFLANMNYI